MVWMIAIIYHSATLFSLLDHMSQADKCVALHKCLQNVTGTHSTWQRWSLRYRHRQHSPDLQLVHSENGSRVNGSMTLHCTLKQHNVYCRWNRTTTIQLADCHPSSGSLFSSFTACHTFIKKQSGLAFSCQQEEPWSANYQWKKKCKGWYQGVLCAGTLCSALHLAHWSTDLWVGDAASWMCCWTPIWLSCHWAWLHRGYWRFRNLIDWLIVIKTYARSTLQVQSHDGFKNSWRRQVFRCSCIATKYSTGTATGHIKQSKPKSRYSICMATL